MLKSNLFFGKAARAMGMDWLKVRLLTVLVVSSVAVFVSVDAGAAKKARTLPVVTTTTTSTTTVDTTTTTTTADTTTTTTTADTTTTTTTADTTTTTTTPTDTTTTSKDVTTSVVGGLTTATSDFFHLVIVPDQTVSASSFEVQVVAENIDPTSLPQAPVVIDASGAGHAMQLKMLKWPGTADDSVSVYSASIPLLPDQTNAIKVTSGDKQIAFSIRHKSVPYVLKAAYPADLTSLVKKALADPSIDVIEIDYDEPDLGGVLNNVGSGITNKRTTWLTVKPALGRTVSWARDYGVSYRRPFADLLHLDGVVFGSDSADGCGGDYYTEIGHRVWLSNVQFRAKYKITWPKTVPMTCSYKPDIRSVVAEGQKIYLTDCSWDGTAPIAATTSVQLARDLRFNSHRGDFNNFGKVFLNAIALDAFPARNYTDTDYLHNDGFQVWGAADSYVFKGFKVLSPNVPAELQPFHFGQTYTPSFSNILLDGFTIEGALVGTPLTGQIAGVMSNSRLSNLSYTGQAVTIRQDFSTVTYPNGAFAPSNVQIRNLSIKKILYIGASSSITYDYTSVANPDDISNELNSNAALAGAYFSNIKVAPSF